MGEGAGRGFLHTVHEPLEGQRVTFLVLAALPLLRRLSGRVPLVLSCSLNPTRESAESESSGGGLGKVVGGESAREGPGGTKRQPPEEDGVTERALDIAGLAARQGQTRS